MITDTITEEARDQIRQMQGEIERLTKQLVKMTNAFERYGHHDSDCIHEPWHGKGAIRCSCGLYEATDLSDD